MTDHRRADELIARLRAALDAATDIGVYPAAVVGAYEQRSPYMQGWNDAVMEVVRTVERSLQHGDLP